MSTYDESLLSGLRKICGYVEDGSHETVHIFQDEATHEWIVRVGCGQTSRWYSSQSFRESILKAIQGEARR